MRPGIKKACCAAETCANQAPTCNQSTRPEDVLPTPPAQEGIILVWNNRSPHPASEQCGPPASCAAAQLLVVVKGSSAARVWSLVRSSRLIADLLPASSFLLWRNQLLILAESLLLFICSIPMLLPSMVNWCKIKTYKHLYVYQWYCVCQGFASWKGGGRQLELVMACYLLPPCILPSQGTFIFYTIQEFSSFLCVVLVKKIEQFFILAFIGGVTILFLM